MSDTTYIAGGLVGVAILGGGIFAFTRVKKETTGTALSSIKLSASSTSVDTNTDITLTATAYDSSNNTLSGISMTLFDKSTSTHTSMGITDSSGNATAKVSFKSSGSYVMYAQGPSGNIDSNNVTITVKAKTTTSTLSSISLKAGAKSVNSGDTVTFTATAYDQNGKVMSDQTVKILDISDQVTIADGSTNSSGVISGTEKYSREGTYSIQASSGSITSNTVTITVTVSNAISKITLTVSTNSAIQGTTVTFTAHVTGVNTSNLSGVDLTLIEKASSQTFKFDSATGSAGKTQVGVTLNTTGTFVFYAEPSNASKPQSNTVTITISSIPTCNSQQYYDSTLGQCVCYSNNASNVSMNQPTTPDLFLQSSMVVRTYLLYNQRLSSEACWITPTSDNKCPSFTFGGRPSCNGTYQYVQVNGTVTDSNGNPCGDQGVCQLYELYFWLQKYSDEFTASQNGVTGSPNGNSWKVKMEYSVFDSSKNQITDSSGTISKGIYPDSNGNFTIYVGVKLDLISTSGQAISGSLYGPDKSIVLSLLSGFSPNVAISGGSLAVTFNVQDCMYAVASG